MFDKLSLLLFNSLIMERPRPTTQVEGKIRLFLPFSEILAELNKIIRENNFQLNQASFNQVTLSKTSENLKGIKHVIYTIKPVVLTRIREINNKDRVYLIRHPKYGRYLIVKKSLSDPIPDQDGWKRTYSSIDILKIKPKILLKNIRHTQHKTTMQLSNYLSSNEFPVLGKQGKIEYPKREHTFCVITGENIFFNIIKDKLMKSHSLAE